MLAFVEGLGSPWYWLVIGFVGQALFFSRFLVQWIASERAKRSVMPTSFWWFSIAGSILLLAYAVHRLDIVFILGQSTGTFIYVRNLKLLAKARAAGDGPA
jgi:lipid-A-disaccharide synthase-like uncharacterized protein